MKLVLIALTVCLSMWAESARVLEVPKDEQQKAAPLYEQLKQANAAQEAAQEAWNKFWRDFSSRSHFQVPNVKRGKGKPATLFRNGWGCGFDFTPDFKYAVATGEARRANGGWWYSSCAKEEDQK
jgi:hypothetical protein